MAYLGIDIGCISLKAALVGAPDEAELFSRLASTSPDLFYTPSTDVAMAGDRPVLVSAYRRIKGSPSEATRGLLDQLLRVLPEEAIAGIRVTGSGGRLIGQALHASFENEFKAIARGLAALHPDVVTVFEMGGETSKYIRLDTDATSGRVGIADYQTNGDCAAGTGSFMDQQASRLLYDIEDVGGVVLDAGKAASIAGRCSVFAKSDMIHAQQKGYQPPEVLKGLCDAVIRNFKGSITKGKRVDAPIAFIGGVAANEGAVQAVRDAFELTDGQLLIPELYAWMGAVGAALIEADEAARRTRPRDLRPRRPAAGRVPLRRTAGDGQGAPVARSGQALRAARRGRHRRVPRHRRRLGLHQPRRRRRARRGHQGHLHEDRRAAGRGRQQGAGRDPRRARRPHPRGRRRHDRLRARAHRRALRRRPDHRRDHRAQDGRQPSSPRRSGARSTRSSRSAGRTPSSSACRTASSSTSP